MAKRGQNDPSKVVKRKSYYGFSREYPGVKRGRGTYLIGDSSVMRRREALTGAAYILMLVLLFALAFVITSAALNISESDPAQAQQTSAVQQTQQQSDTTQQTEAIQ